MNDDIHAALFAATPPRAESSAARRVGVAWWGSASEHGACHCCGRSAQLHKGYNGGAHMPARFCTPCTQDGHAYCGGSAGRS